MRSAWCVRLTAYNIEMFQYGVPTGKDVPKNQRHRRPTTSRSMFDDIEESAATSSPRTSKTAGPDPIKDGPLPRAIDLYLLATGAAMELISYPKGMEYQKGRQIRCCG